MLLGKASFFECSFLRQQQKACHHDWILLRSQLGSCVVSFVVNGFASVGADGEGLMPSILSRKPHIPILGFDPSEFKVVGFSCFCDMLMWVG